MSGSIYRTELGRETMADWYQHFLELLGPDEIEFMEVPTRYGKTNILVTGDPDAPPLWCFHGAMSSAPAALAQVQGLKGSFRIHFPDTVGQPGRSEESRLDWQGEDHGHWVVDILDALGVSKIDAFGCSLGGYVVLRAAQVAPARIQRAGLWVPAGLVKPPVAPMLGLIGAGLLYAVRPSRRRLERILERTTTDLDDTYVGFMADALAHVHADRRFPALLPDGALDAWGGHAMLVAHGLDTVFPAGALVARARSLIPKLGGTIVVEDFRHMPSFRPERLEPVLDAFVSFFTRDLPPRT